MSAESGTAAGDEHTGESRTGAAGPVFLRIEKGEPDPLELAAITTALFKRLTAVPPESGRPAQAPAPWRRPERSPGFQGPRTWHDSAN